MGRHLSLQFNANVLGAAEGIALNPAVNSVDLLTPMKASPTITHCSTQSQAPVLKGVFVLSAVYLVQEHGRWFAAGIPDELPLASCSPYPGGGPTTDIANAFKIFGLWQPVIFHGANNWLEKLVGGWSVSGNSSPITPAFPADPVHTNIAGGSLYYQGSNNNQLRPAAYLGGAGRNTSNGAFWSGPGGANQSSFNQTLIPTAPLSHFTIPTYTPRHRSLPATFAPPAFLGVARNALNGPNYRDVDASLTRSSGIPKVPVLAENAVEPVPVSTPLICSITSI